MCIKNGISVIIVMVSLFLTGCSKGSPIFEKEYGDVFVHYYQKGAKVFLETNKKSINVDNKKLYFDSAVLKSAGYVLNIVNVEESKANPLVHIIVYEYKNSISGNIEKVYYELQIGSDGNISILKEPMYNFF